MDTIQPLLQLDKYGHIHFWSKKEIAQIVVVIVHEWRTNPWILERDVPPWITFDLFEGHVRISSNNIECPKFWRDIRLHSNDFWLAMERLMVEFIDRPHDKPIVRVGQTVYFSHAKPYAQQLSQALLDDSDFLILDLRRIIATFIFFI